MNALKIILLLVLVYAGIYTTTAAVHIGLRTWASYKYNKNLINAQGLQGLRLLTKFCSSFILVLIQTVATLIWDLYRDEQFPIVIRIPITIVVLYLAATAVIPINLIINGIIESLLKVHRVDVKLDIDPNPQPKHVEVK